MGDRKHTVLTPEERLARMSRYDEYVVLWKDSNGFAAISKYHGHGAAEHAAWRLATARLEDPDARCYRGSTRYADVTAELAGKTMHFPMTVPSEEEKP